MTPITHSAPTPPRIGVGWAIYDVDVDQAAPPQRPGFVIPGEPPHMVVTRPLDDDPHIAVVVFETMCGLSVSNAVVGPWETTATPELVKCSACLGLMAR